MKNFIHLFFLGIFLFSCSKEKKIDENAVRNSELQQQNSEKITAIDPILEGKNLIEGASCLSCHQIKEKMIGPSYLDVAGKYENTPENTDILAEKIINGGSGNWGEIPMTAHPGLSKENAQKMVKYILSLKK